MQASKNPNKEDYQEMMDNYQPRFAPDRMAHIVIKTVQADKLVDWYKLVFDAQVVFSQGPMTFLTYDKVEHHRIAIMSLPKILYPSKFLTKNYRKLFGFDHIAFTFDSLERLLRNYKRLKNAGIVPVWCINHGPTTSLYYEDPDGNRFEFQVDNFDDIGEVIDWMGTGEFEKNPIGVNFDPDYLLDRLESGAPPKELTERGAGVPPGQKRVEGFKALLNWKAF